jgi:hypothetical protein
MKLSFPNLPDLGRVIVALKNVRWRDPLVQVWGLIGVVLVTGIVIYYVRHSGTGEQKNSSRGAELLTAFAENAGWRPMVSFSEAAPVPSDADGTASGLDLDLRACANEAAARKTWRFLTPDLRRQISRRATTVRSVLVTWSGTRGGDANALDLYFASVRDDSRGSPGDFVIGNGHRSHDGAVEFTRRWTPQAPDDETAHDLRICLVGDTRQPTPAQKEALGELISFIEARSGTVTLSMHHPAPPGLLAHAD